jgi:CHAT domain-containing protein/tetratricopeptide (TPR) repeat protein
LLVPLVSWFVVTAAAAQETPLQEAKRLQESATRLNDQGKYGLGIEAATRSLALKEQTLGSEHPEVADSVHLLARLQTSAGQYDLALAGFQRAFTMREKVLGPEHPATARSLVNVAKLHYLIDEYSKAEPLYQRVLAILEKNPGSDDVLLGNALQGLGELYAGNAAYDSAEAVYKRALTVQERASSPGSLQVCKILRSLGGMYGQMGAYARAKAAYSRALAIAETLEGPDHPHTATILADFANIYVEGGMYAEAEQMYERALTIQERTIGGTHVTTSVTLINLGTLYKEVGSYSQAESLLRRALSIQQQAPGGLELSAISLSNLADMYLEANRPEQAEPLFKQALETAEKVLGASHPLTAHVVGHLGDTYRRMGAYDKAEPLLKRATVMTEAAQGPEHRHAGFALYALANLYFERAEYTKAQQLYQRAISTYEKSMGVNNRLTTRAMRALARTHWARGEIPQALPLMQRVQRIQSKNSQRFLATGSEARKQDYQRSQNENISEDVSFAMSVGNAATALGASSVLQHKGRVLDTVSDDVARLRRSVAPADQALLEKLADVAGQLSALTYGKGANMPTERYRTMLAQLSAQQEQLETELANRSQVFRRATTPVTLANVQRAIPENAVLVEWFRYTPVDPRKSARARTSVPRYVAYVLKRAGEPIALDVGEAQAIEALAGRLRAALADSASGDVKQRSAALFAKILAPLRVHLRGVEQILFSPDGELNLIPMAALVDESGAYLTERFDVSYLTSGRDLLRIADESAALSGAVVIADPDYGKRSAAFAATTTSLQPKRSPELDRGGLTFRQLTGTALEAQDLKALLKLDETSVLQRREASESNLKRFKSPRILHIASHGFFLSDQELTAEIKRRSSSSTTLATSENPLLRSGIALAGANERNSGDDDGILTALEATQLDLSGTELVVLSACDTGVGEIQNGEGVYGLRRALALAGAQTQVTSLWKVSDDVTRNLMVDYYRRLQQGEGRSAALRSTQRAMLGNKAFAHPYYWASFIPIGNWKPLPPLPSKRSATR